MAFSNDIEGVQEHLVNGHVTRYCVNVPNFGGRVPFDFERSFDFICSVMSTSWKFQVSFQKHPHLNSLLSHVTIRRVDNGMNIANVDFYMKLLLNDPPTVTPLRSFTMTDIPSRRSFTYGLNEVLPPEVMLHLGERPVMIEIAFNVYSCHEEDDGEGNIDEAHEPLVLSSKM